MTAWIPERVFIEEGVRDDRTARRILTRLPGIPVETVSGAEDITARFRLVRDPVSFGKASLFLSRRKGPFVKACPCTPGHVRCGYFVVNLDLQCPQDCSYCVLQHYLNPPIVTTHVNRDDMWAELDRFLESRPGGLLRIGTGELGDSLALDHLTENSVPLIEYFRGKPGVYFELKTKTGNVHNVLEAEPAENVVVSWSLNAEGPAADEERNAPPIGDRLDAARRVSLRGFPVGFHFDPLILHEGWKSGYRETVHRMLAAVRPERIAWISLGSLRFNPELKPFIRERFPGSRVTGQEFVRGKDGKLRYFRPDRIKLYRSVLEMIREFGGGDVPVYLCMESAEIWERVFEGGGDKKNGERKVSRSSFPRPLLSQDHLCRWT